MDIFYNINYFGVRHEIELIILNKWVFETLFVLYSEHPYTDNPSKHVYKYDIDKGISAERFLKNLKRR
jgi:hypothetical protein